MIEVGGEWRLQTKESAEWESAYRSEEKAILADQSGLTMSRKGAAAGTRQAQAMSMSRAGATELIALIFPTEAGAEMFAAGSPKLGWLSRF